MTRTEQYQAPLFRLKKDIPLAKAGTIFYYDREDHEKGSLAEGCLKLAWTADGNCQGGLCADTIVFHANARGAVDWFEPVNKDTAEVILKELIEFMDKWNSAFCQSEYYSRAKALLHSAQEAK